jgi:predicted nucleic acid-binding protein
MINHDSFIFKPTKEKDKEEINIAIEIFIAKQYSCVHYLDLMDEIPDGLVSKDRLIKWLNDAKYKGKISRKGIITMYKEKNPQYFINGIWQAYTFCDFISFMKEHLIDVEYVKKQEIANMFRESFQDEEWYNSAIAVAGAKLLEDLYDRNALLTDTAKAYVHGTKLTRKMLGDIGKIVGNVGKNHDISDFKKDIMNVINHDFTEVLKSAFQIYADKPEQKCYLKYEKGIRQKLIDIQNSVLLLT